VIGSVSKKDVMPHDYFPPLWLPFVAFGKFSKSPVPQFDGAEVESKNKQPLHARVPNRTEIRGLGAGNKRGSTTETPCNGTSKKHKGDDRMLIAVQGIGVQYGRHRAYGKDKTCPIHEKC